MNAFAMLLLAALEVGLPVALGVWLVRKSWRNRKPGRAVSRQIRRECANLDAEYARLVRRGGRV